MDIDLKNLEEKIAGLIAYTRQLRQENISLKLSLQVMQTELQQYEKKIESISEKVRYIITNLPEDEASVYEVEKDA